MKNLRLKKKMQMNCTQFDEVQRNIETFFVDTDLGTAAGLGAVVVVSLALLVRGEKLVRPLGAVLGGLAGVVVAFLASAAAGIEACEVRVVAAGIAGVLLAVVALCLLKAGLFLLGAAGMGVVGHLAYVSLPIDASGAPFELLGIPAYHYFAVGGAAIFGGVVSQLQKKHFVRTVSSALGGSGLGACTHVALVLFDAEGLTPLLPLVVALGSTAGGCFAQSRLETRSKRKKDRKRSQRRNDAELRC